MQNQIGRAIAIQIRGNVYTYRRLWIRKQLRGNWSLECPVPVRKQNLKDDSVGGDFLNAKIGLSVMIEIGGHDHFARRWRRPVGNVDCGSGALQRSVAIPKHDGNLAVTLDGKIQFA